MSWDREKERKAGKTWHMGVSLVALIFGIFWCLAALSMGAGFMLVFGIPVVGLMAYRLVMVAKHGEDKPKQPLRQEADPWDRQERPVADGFCPYCGSSVEETFEYCPKCGRKLK
jgi:hypothetical protein